MRATEFLPEIVTRAETSEHLIKRLKFAAQLCQQMGDTPLLFREFSTGINKETVLAKVINDTDEGPRSPKYVKGGQGRDAQRLILELLGIENPVFTKMKAPDSTFGFHGDPHIFIPLPGASAVYSPVVKDLGGQTTTDYEKPKDGWTVVGRMKNEAERYASTYVSGVPKEFTDHEVIFDCPEYYLLNIQSFLHRFSGKENKYAMTQGSSIWKNIDPSVWSERVRTYSDVAKFLANNGVGYVRWYQNNVEKTPMFKRPEVSKPSWMVTGTSGRSVMVSADDEREAIWRALNSRGATGQSGTFPRGREDVVSAKKL